MLRPNEVESVIGALEEHYSEHLSSWEVDFVSSLREQWEARGALSVRQLEVLDSVFERVSGGGRDGGRSR